MTKPRNEEYVSFVKLTDALLSVPRADIQKGLERHKREAEKNPRKRGPKRKAK